MSDQIGADVVARDRCGLLSRRTGSLQQGIRYVHQTFG
jgi:hypothetical protein